MDERTTLLGEAYISGALTGAADAAPLRLFYEVLAEIASRAGLRPYLPHRATDPVAAAHLDARTVYEIDRAHVTGAAVLIGYAGVPSFGVGIEVELARQHGIPVILVAERERAVSRILLGDPAVVDVVRFADLEGLRRDLTAALERVATLPRTGAARVSDEVVVQRFLASLGEARQVPEAEVAALLRIAELDGGPAAEIRRAVADGRLFGAGLRDLVGRHALRGTELGLFVLRDALERPLAESARLFGCDARAAKRHLASARARVGLPEDADGASVGQWLVTELIAPPTRALQLHLFGRPVHTGGQ
ncbi:MAG TPA: hypothetical protein VFM93_09420 [Candidatus Limnocylindria bacterium]|nr:hypothetical protein [Candidatus Limnocylindria bacterium]